MKTYEFKICLIGMGNNVEQAWWDAIENFEMDPGPVPEHPHGEVSLIQDDNEEELDGSISSGRV